MSTPSAARLRAFVRDHTRLSEVPDLAGVRLYLGDDVMELCQSTGRELGIIDPALPYWAFAWPGGLAVARFLLENPQEVAGREVIDLAAGSGVCGIVALRCGAEAVEAIDIDPFASAAVALNARANGVRVGFSGDNALDLPPTGREVILAGDVLYEEAMSGTLLDWLHAAAAAGSRVLIGDPGRRYLPRDLERVATYQVRTTREIEDAETKRASVYTIQGGDGRLDPRSAAGAESR